jgi:anti-sigma-K factor RskA
LSDEAVAAFADGVLTGHARERATRHTEGCAECRQAVRVQREAVFALRAAPAPALPSDLLARLRTVPMTTPITTLPTAIGPDGTTMLATFAPMAALAPSEPARTTHRMRPFVATAAVVAMAGALAASSVAHQEQPAQTGTGHFVNTFQSGPAFDGQLSTFRFGRP